MSGRPMLSTIRILERATDDWQPLEPVIREAMSLVAPGKALRRYKENFARVSARKTTSVTFPEKSDSEKIASGARALVQQSVKSCLNGGHIEVKVDDDRTRYFRSKVHPGLLPEHSCSTCGWSPGNNVRRLNVPPLPVSSDVPEEAEALPEPEVADVPVIPLPQIRGTAVPVSPESLDAADDRRLAELFCEVQDLRVRMEALEVVEGAALHELSLGLRKMNDTLAVFYKHRRLLEETAAAVAAHERILSRFTNRADRRSG